MELSEIVINENGQLEVNIPQLGKGIIVGINSNVFGEAFIVKGIE